jgi:hypothetical protein
MPGCTSFPAYKFHDSQGNLVPDIASGYYSTKVVGVNFGTLQPLTVRQLYSYACPGGYTTQASRDAFCSNLFDSGGNIVPLPQACGGTGPDVLQPYNPTIAALNAVQDTGNTLLEKYTAATKEKVKLITQIGIALALIVLLIGIIWIVL